jgi:nitrate reductase (cytochrome), electron transfer subunit
MSEGARDPVLRGRALHVFVAVVTAVAAIGLMVGTSSRAHRGPVASSLPAAEISPPPADVMAARAYTEIARDPLRRGYPGAAELEGRAIGPLGLEGPVTPQDAARARAREERDARRAFEGAPPVIPHPSAQLGPLACMACHDKGLRVGLYTAPPMSHEFREACTQCHVSSGGAVPFAEHAPDELPLDSQFVGLRGAEVWVGPPGAPSMIPHTTHMRERCESCHGAAGREGLRTSHVWRASCTQCHAAAAAYQQQPGGGYQEQRDVP